MDVTDPIATPHNDFCRACSKQKDLGDMKCIFRTNNLLEIYRICTSLEVYLCSFINN